LYDSSSTSVITAKSVGYVKKDENIVELGIPVKNGLVVSPGTGQKLVIVYSKG
jgi:hypothetical protein